MVATIEVASKFWLPLAAELAVEGLDREEAVVGRVEAVPGRTNAVRGRASPACFCTDPAEENSSKRNDGCQWEPFVHVAVVSTLNTAVSLAHVPAYEEAVLQHYTPEQLCWPRGSRTLLYH